ncbi:unnamed protein product [Symbiodinium sp. CCMP2456]|nr:unnamed protein product [Symbiodinium sp. CCMP2456]
MADDPEPAVPKPKRATPFYGKPFPVGQLPKAWFRWAPLAKRPPPVLPMAGSIPGTVPVGRQPPKAKAARDTWLRVVKAKSVPAKSPVLMQPTEKYPAHFRSFGCSEEQAVETDVESPPEAASSSAGAAGGGAGMAVPDLAAPRMESCPPCRPCLGFTLILARSLWRMALMAMAMDHPLLQGLCIMLLAMFVPRHPPPCVCQMMLAPRAMTIRHPPSRGLDQASRAAPAASGA